MIYNPDNPAAGHFGVRLNAALPLSIQPIIAPIHSLADIERAIGALAAAAQRRHFFPPDITTVALPSIIAIVARHRLPAIYADRF